MRRIIWETCWPAGVFSATTVLFLVFAAVVGGSIPTEPEEIQDLTRIGLVAFFLAVPIWWCFVSRWGEPTLNRGVRAGALIGGILFLLNLVVLAIEASAPQAGQAGIEMPEWCRDPRMLFVLSQLLAFVFVMAGFGACLGLLIVEIPRGRRARSLRSNQTESH